MKKTMVKSRVWIIAAAALAVCAAIVLGVFGFTRAKAESSITQSEGTAVVTLTYTVAEGWTVSITGDWTFSDSNGNQVATGTVTMSDYKINAGQKVSVKVESGNGWKLKNGENKIDYTLAVADGGISSSGELAVMDVNDTDKDAKTKTLTATITKANVDGATVAGSYTDTLTFTATESTKGA